MNKYKSIYSFIKSKPTLDINFDREISSLLGDDDYFTPNEYNATVFDVLLSNKYSYLLPVFIQYYIKTYPTKLAHLCYYKTYKHTPFYKELLDSYPEHLLLLLHNEHICDMICQDLLIDIGYYYKRTIDYSFQTDTVKNIELCLMKLFNSRSFHINYNMHSGILLLYNNYLSDEITIANSILLKSNDPIAHSIYLLSP
jgi:hypothetical protein